MGDQSYTINDEFRQQTIQIADELDLDEVECARLFLYAQNDAIEIDRSPIVSAIIRFHKHRQFLLESLRLAFQEGVDDDDYALDEAQDELEGDLQTRINEEKSRARQVLRAFTTLVLNSGENRVQNASTFWTKCTRALEDIEANLQRVADRTQRASVVGQSLSKDEEQIMEYERSTLNTQHESLSAIATFLIRHGYASLDNFVAILKRAKTLERHDVVMLHHLPIILACVAQFGSSIASCPEDDIKSLHSTITSFGDANPWSLRSLLYAVQCWWMVEYKGRFPEPQDNHSTDSEQSADAQLLGKALREGGLKFMLSVAKDVKHSDWHDPPRVGLTEFLLKDVPVLPDDSAKPAPYFQALLMELFQNFVDSFITNMPDTLRLLKFEEDDQRKQIRARFHGSPAEYPYHLEVFLVLISYAYQDSPDAAKSFWVDVDGHLYGFLQWASRRQTTPRVAAFCEMLRSLSEGSDGADSAHQFLLAEGPPVAGKLRRTASLSWNQIFAELEYYVSVIKDRAGPAHSGVAEPQRSMEFSIEPESSIMIECYLRLMTHICYGSESARKFLWTVDGHSILGILFQLCGSVVEPRVRGCVFSALAALLARKSASDGEILWFWLEQWTSGVSSPSPAIPKQAISPASLQLSGARAFDIISHGFEESDSFMRLLNALVMPKEEDGLSDEIPFPTNLGSPYRLPGINSYIDFALGKIFTEKSVKLTDRYQLPILRLNCLNFICTGLSSFNEDLVIIANRSGMAVEDAMHIPSLEAYTKLHPFGRIMEWLFDSKCLDALFAAARQDVDQINQHEADSPLVLSLVRAIEAMIFVMNLQPTYIDIVRPLLRNQAGGKPVTHSPVASFEDAVLKHLDLIVNLGLYCGLGHSELTLVSLTLLEKIASSRRLSILGNPGKRGDRSKLLGVLEKDDESERISRSLAISMAFDMREFEGGLDTSGYKIKSAIIAFLKNSLAASPERPCIAHLLLGFKSRGNELYVEDGGLFSAGLSLLHSVARLALDYPDFDGQSFVAWAGNIKEACTEMLRLLWTSPVSASVTLAALRNADYLFLQAVRQASVGANTYWDGKTISDPDFIMTDSAISLKDFLLQRRAHLDLFARELRFAKAGGMTSVLLRLQSALFGLTTFPGDEPVQNSNIFGLFDFMELDCSSEIAMPPLEYFRDEQFHVCKAGDSDKTEYFDLSRAREVISLQRNIRTSNQAQPKDQQESALQVAGSTKFEEESTIVLLILLGRNHWRELSVAHTAALNAWIKLIIVVIETCALEENVHTSFIQQAFQLVQPKFERAFREDLDSVLPFAGLINTLMTALYANGAARSKEAAAEETDGTVASSNSNSDMEFQVFRTALNAITSNASSIPLREQCYQICYQYLRHAARDSAKTSLRRRNVVKNIRLVNDKLIDIICDDALTSDAKTRISALLVLETLVAVFALNDSKFILSRFDKLNFIGILVDVVKQIPTDLREAQPVGMSLWTLLGRINAVRRRASPWISQLLLDSPLADSSNPRRGDFALQFWHILCHPAFGDIFHRS